MDRNGELHTSRKQPAIHIKQKDEFSGTEKNLLSPDPTVGTVLTVLSVLDCVSWGTHFQHHT